MCPRGPLAQTTCPPDACASARRRALAGRPQLLANDLAQGLFEQAVGAAADVFPQDRVDQDQVVAAARVVDLLAEPIDDLVIERQRDRGLARGRGGYNRAPRAFAEVVGLFMAQSLYCFRSLASALRAEMIRMVLGARYA